MALPARAPSRQPPPSADKEQHEVEDVHRKSAPSGAVVYAAVHMEGRDELKRGTLALAWSGLAAGLSMGFSFVAEALLHRYLPDAEWRPLVSKLGYSVGFLIVILGRQQLFTENTLTVILPLLRRPSLRTVGQVARLWTVVLAANLVGAFAFAFVVARTSAFDGPVHESFGALSAAAMDPPFATLLLRGVFAGWLIALMVWLLPFAEAARVWVIVIVTYVVGLASFSHIIVGSIEAFYLVAAGARTAGDYVAFLLPALLGNVIGGVSMVAAFAHAQFIAASDEGETRVATTE